MATGAIDSFSWKGVALSAISGGVSAGVASVATPGSLLAEPIVRGAVVNAAAQGIGVVTGLQEQFSWRAVAASGIGAGAGDAVGDAVRSAIGEGLISRFASGFAGGLAAAAVGGGRVSVQQVATDAFGNALGESLTERMKGVGATQQASIGSEDVLGEFIAKNNNWAHANVGPMPALVDWQTFSENVAMRKSASDPFGLRVYAQDASGVMQSAQSLWGSLPASSRVLSDTSTDADLLQNHMHRAGYYDDLMPTGGNVRVAPGTVNGVSVNQRVNNAFQAAGDLAGIGDMYRDYRLLGGLMGEVQQQAIIDRLKGTLQDRLGMMRVSPTPEAMGAVPVIDSDGVPRFNNADLIERYSDAVRKVELMRKGVIELDTRTMLIMSVGAGKLSPAQWVAENTRRYGEAFAAGMNEGQRRHDAGKLYYPFDMPGQLQVGLFADDAARVAVIQYNRSIGVPEGPGQLLSMNRWSYDPSGSGAYNRVDLLMDLGPSRNSGAMILRTAIEGKGSMAAVQSSAGQLQRVYDWITPNIRTVTPQGVLPWTPQPKRLR